MTINIKLVKNWFENCFYVYFYILYLKDCLKIIKWQKYAIFRIAFKHFDD